MRDRLHARARDTSCLFLYVPVTACLTVAAMVRLLELVAAIVFLSTTQQLDLGFPVMTEVR